MASRYRGCLRSTLLVLAVTVGFFVFAGPVVVQAAGVDPTNISGSPGDTVTLEVLIDTAVSDMGAWGFDVHFDTDVLTYSGVDKTGTISEPLTVDGTATSSGAHVEASGAGPAATADPGILIKVLLTVKETAHMNSAIHLDNFSDYLSGAETADSLFTVLIAIAVDSPGEPFVNAQGVHLLTSGAVPSAAVFSGRGAPPGDYHWALIGCGGIDASTADTITYTAPAATDGATCEATLVLTGASQPDASTDTIKVFVYKPLTITWPTSAAGMALNDETRRITASGGTGTYVRQSSDVAVATVDADGDIMPVGAGIFTVKVRDQEFGAFDMENGFAAETPRIEIINPIVIGNKPSDGSLQSQGVHQFTAQGGKEEGLVYWEASHGAIDPEGNYTAPNVPYEPAQPDKYVMATIVAYDRTYNKNHPTPVKTTYTLVVYPTLSIAPPAGFDAAKPLSPGDGVALSGRGGDRECVWTVTGPVAVAGDDTSCTYNFAAPSEGDFAGVYEIALSDGSGFTATYDVKVSMQLFPEVLNFTAATIDGDVNPQHFEVTGTSGADYSWQILKNPDDEDPVSDPASFGIWSRASPVPVETANTFLAADVNKPRTFHVRVLVENDPDLNEENGLDRIVRGPYRIIPIRTFGGYVVDEGRVSIEGATVEVTAPADWATVTRTDGSGFFSLDLPDSGTTYLMRAVKAGYVSKEFTSRDLDGKDVRDNVVRLLTAAPDACISGTVTVEGEQSPAAVHVQAYYDLDGGVIPAGVMKTTEAFRFDFEADHSPYTLTASMPGYFTKTTVSGPLPVADLQLDLGPRTLGTCVDAAAGGFIDFAEVPFGAIDTSTGADEVCFDLTVKDTGWACGQGQGEFFYRITAVDQIQRAVTFTGEMTMTLSFDLSQVPPGAFETGRFAVYQASALDKCTAVEVLDSDRIVATDYVGDGATGSVTFRTSHLSDFGIGEVGVEEKGGLSGDSDSRCFIATAAYGSPFDRNVGVLRQFRDEHLMSSRAGRFFVDTYYRVSPAAAEWIAGCDTRRAGARLALWPFVLMSCIMLQIGFVGSLCMLAAAPLLCFGLWRLSRRTLRKGVFMALPLVLVFWATAGSARAADYYYDDDEKARYYGALYGVYALEDFDDSDTKGKFEDPVDVDFDDSLGLQARFGYIYNEYIAVEGMFEYISDFESKDGGLGVEFEVMNFMVNGKLCHPGFDLFVPYVTAGLGVMNAYEEIHYRGDNSKDSDWGFSGRAGLGFDYYVQPDWTVCFETAYVAGVGGVDNVRYVTLAFGVGYHW